MRPPAPPRSSAISLRCASASDFGFSPRDTVFALVAAALRMPEPYGSLWATTSPRTCDLILSVQRAPALARWVANPTLGAGMACSCTRARRRAPPEDHRGLARAAVHMNMPCGWTAGPDTFASGDPREHLHGDAKAARRFGGARQTRVVPTWIGTREGKPPSGRDQDVRNASFIPARETSTGRMASSLLNRSRRTATAATP